MKKYIILILIASLVLTSCWQEEKKVVKYYSTWTVQTWSIDLNNSFVWYVESENTIPLSTKVWWRVSNLYVDIWDKVNAWELLVELDWSEAKVWYKTSENIISSLQALKESTSLMFDSQIKAMGAKVEQAKAWNLWTHVWLQDAKNITDSQLKTTLSWVNQAEIWLELAQTNLEKTKLVLETKKHHIYKNTINAITNSVILDTNVLNFVDNLIWITEANKNKNDSYENYLSAKNSSHLTDSKEEFIEANKLFKEYKSLFEEKIENKTPDNETIENIAQKWITIAEKLKILLSSTYDVLDNSVESINFPQTTIDSYKSQVSQMWQDIESSLLTVSWDYILWLKWSIENMESFSTESDMQISLLEKQVSLAEQSLETASNTYEQYKSMSQGQVNEVNTQKDIANQSLNEALAWLEALKKQKETSLNEIQAKLSEALWQQDNAWVMISNSKIVSPISWIVIDKSVEIWQVIWWWVPVIILADENNLKIKVWVSDEIANSISIWNKVQISIESINNHVVWTIISIYPSKDNITKKNIVEIKVENHENIKIWSMAKVYFENLDLSDTNSIIIPIEAILQKYMLPWVYVLKNWKAIFKNIKILEQNETLAKVTWLEAWEIIITQGKENIYDWEELN